MQTLSFAAVSILALAAAVIPTHCQCLVCSLFVGGHSGVRLDLASL